MAYIGLKYGRKEREFSNKQDAEYWKDRNQKKGKIGKYKGKNIVSIRRICN